MEAEIVDIDGKEGVAVSLVFDESRLDQLYKQKIINKLKDLHIEFSYDDNGGITYDYEKGNTYDISKLLIDYRVIKKEKDGLNANKNYDKRLEAKLDRLFELLMMMQLDK